MLRIHFAAPLLLLALLIASACSGGIPVQAGARPDATSPLPSLSPTPLLNGAGPDATPPKPSPLSPTPLLNGARPDATTSIPSPLSPTSLPTTTLLFTGVIVPARCVQAAIDERGDSDYMYEEVREVISRADLAVGTLNAVLSDYPPRTGCLPTYVLVGGAQNAPALARAGFDVLGVATNHIKNCGPANCGDRAFFDTLDNLREAGLLPVGAGANLKEAMRPLVVTLNGVRFGIVSLGQIEPLAFAADKSPGIAALTEESLRAAIAAARRSADVVIAMPHWGPEDVATPNWSQRQLAQVAVEAGADLVVGNHTHVVQAVQTIDGVPVFYGLGNFVFDQDWARDHQQGVILIVTFKGDKLESYELIPTHVDGDGRVHLAGAEEAAEVLERIEQVSEALP